MDEPNATRVSAPPVEVAERSDRPYVRKQLQVSLRLETTYSAAHVCGLLLEVLTKRGHVVESIRVNRSDKPLAKYERPRGDRT
jgi:hypothetical protein